MENATVYHLPALVGIEFTHGLEIVPTAVDDLPIRYATVDADGTLTVWNSPQAPELDVAGAWHASDPLDAALGFRPAVVHGIDDDATPGGRYPYFAESLRKITAGDLCRRQ